MPEKTLIDGIDEYVPSMSSYLKKHVGPQATDKVKITAVTDIEELVWSPRCAVYYECFLVQNMLVHHRSCVIHAVRFPMP